MSAHTLQWRLLRHAYPSGLAHVESLKRDLYSRLAPLHEPPLTARAPSQTDEAFTPVSHRKREQCIFFSVCMLTNACIHTGSRSSALASSRSVAWAAVLRSFRRRVYFCCAAYAELKSQCIRVVTVPTFQYSVPIPVKIHGSRYQFRYQSKTQKYAN